MRLSQVERKAGRKVALCAGPVAREDTSRRRLLARSDCGRHTVATYRDSITYQTIHRQPSDWRDILARDPSELRRAADRLVSARQIVIAGVGTSHHAAQVAAFFFRAAGRTAWPIMSADLAYPINLAADDALIVISHRGTKRFPLRSMQAAREAGALCLGITGQGSQMSGPDQIIQTVAGEQSS